MPLQFLNTVHATSAYTMMSLNSTMDIICSAFWMLIRIWFSITCWSNSLVHIQLLNYFVNVFSYITSSAKVSIANYSCYMVYASGIHKIWILHCKVDLLFMNYFSRVFAQLYLPTIKSFYCQSTLTRSINN